MSVRDFTTSVEYKTILECPDFRFGSDGSVWKFSDGCWQPVQGTPRSGGQQIYVWINGKRKLARRHLMIARAFHGSCPPGLKCRRLDGDTANDRPDNLVWDDKLEDVSGRTEKPCAGCGITKSLDEFARRSISRDGRDEQCKACRNAKTRAYMARPEVKARVKRREAPAKLKYLYGITSDDYKTMLASQCGVCAICRKPPEGGPRTSRLYVDHDHDTGKVRGLLCRRCNQALGTLGDNIEGLMRAIDYLKKAEGANE